VFGRPLLPQKEPVEYTVVVVALFYTVVSAEAEVSQTLPKGISSYLIVSQIAI
jgi:hypothetical protein